MVCIIMHPLPLRETIEAQPNKCRKRCCLHSLWIDLTPSFHPAPSAKKEPTRDSSGKPPKKALSPIQVPRQSRGISNQTRVLGGIFWYPYKGNHKGTFSKNSSDPWFFQHEIRLVLPVGLRGAEKDDHPKGAKHRQRQGAHGHLKLLRLRLLPGGSGYFLTNYSCSGFGV